MMPYCYVRGAESLVLVLDQRLNTAIVLQTWEDMTEKVARILQDPLVILHFDCHVILKVDYNEVKYY